MRCVATGYGRVSVDYADKVVTEITCHGRGGWMLFQKTVPLLMWVDRIPKRFGFKKDR